MNEFYIFSKNFGQIIFQKYKSQKDFKSNFFIISLMKN